MSDSAANVLGVASDHSSPSCAADTLKKEVSTFVMVSTPRTVDRDEPALLAPGDLAESFHLVLAPVVVVWLALPLTALGTDLDPTVPKVLKLAPSLTTSFLRICLSGRHCEGTMCMRLPVSRLHWDRSSRGCDEMQGKADRSEGLAPRLHSSS